MPFLVYYRALLLVCYFINLYLLAKQHFPPLWWMRVCGSLLSAFITFKELSILGKSCCPQPVTRLFRLNFWKSRKSVCLKQGWKVKLNHMKSFSFWQNHRSINQSRKKNPFTWYPTNTTDLQMDRPDDDPAGQSVWAEVSQPTHMKQHGTLYNHL